MALEEFPTDLNGEYVEHLHLLDSDQAGWDKLGLIYELEPAGEMPEAVTPSHALVICLGHYPKIKYQFSRVGNTQVIPYDLLKNTFAHLTRYNLS